MSKLVLDQLASSSLKRVAKRPAPYFTRDEIRVDMLKRKGLAEALIDVRRAHRFLALDEAILRYIDQAIGRALQSKDDRGVRLYESYSAGIGARRWRRFTSMTAPDLSRVIEEHVALRDAIDDKIALYQLTLDEMRRTGSQSVAEVYEFVVATLGMGPAAADEEAA